MLKTIVFMLPFALVILTIIYALVRSIAQAWVQHRVQMSLLEKLEARPDLLDQLQEVQDLLAAQEAARDVWWRPDFILTGVILAGLGIVCAVTAAALGGSQTATAAYFGGVICVCLGFILAIIGLLMHYLSDQGPIKRFRDEWEK